MWVAFAKATHIFSTKNINVFAIFQDRNFNIMLTNNLLNFEQLGPGVYVYRLPVFYMVLSISQIFKVPAGIQSVEFPKKCNHGNLIWF